MVPFAELGGRRSPADSPPFSHTPRASESGSASAVSQEVVQCVTFLKVLT